MIETINLNSKGKNILIIAGVHGDEVGTVKLAFELFDYYKSLIEPKDFPNYVQSITFITNANISGIRSGTRDMQGTSNLNDIWDRQNISIQNEITQYINKSDIVIDLHCSPYIHNTFLLEIGDPKSYIIKTFLENHFSKEISDGKVSYMTRSTKINSIKTFVNSYVDKFGITWEQMGMDQISYNNDNSKEILIKFINLIGDIFYNKEYLNKTNKCIKLPSTIVSTSCEGYLNYHKKLGDYIVKDEVLADITDLNTNRIITEITSPVEGMFVCGSNSLYVNFGDFIGIIQPF